MMAAGTAAQNGKKVLVIEKMEKAGRKIRITGKGRCNLTNARPPEEFAEQVRTNADFFATAFAEFNNRATIRFFERRGLKLDFRTRRPRISPQRQGVGRGQHAGKSGAATTAWEFWFHTRVTGLMTLGGKIFGVRYMNRRGFERKGRGRTGDRRHGRRLLPRHRLDGRRLHVRQRGGGTTSNRCVRRSRRSSRRTRS